MSEVIHPAVKAESLRLARFITSPPPPPYEVGERVERGQYPKASDPDSSDVSGSWEASSETALARGGPGVLGVIGSRATVLPLLPRVKGSSGPDALRPIKDDDVADRVPERGGGG